MTAADGVNRRKIQHVKAHVVNHRQSLDHVIKGAVPGGIVGHRTREQFVPTGELGERAFHLDRVARTEADVGVILRLRHEVSAAFMEKQRHLFGFEQTGQLNQQRLQLRLKLTLGALNGVLHQHAAFLQLKAHRHPGLVFFLQLMAKTGKAIDPGFDAELIASLQRHLELPRPAIIAHERHGRGGPFLMLGTAPMQHHGQLIMAIGEDLGGDVHRPPLGCLDGKLAVFQHRGGAFDGNARQQQRMGQRQYSG